MRSGGTWGSGGSTLLWLAIGNGFLFRMGLWGYGIRWGGFGVGNGLGGYGWLGLRAVGWCIVVCGLSCVAKTGVVDW